MKIVCIGDSLTEGYGIEKAYCWPTLLSNYLNIEIINSGISGDTTAGMLARFHQQVVSYNPTHVIIMGGTNDLSFNLSNELIISNILAMTRHAKNNEIIPIIGIPSPFYHQKAINDENQFINSENLSKRIESYQKALKQFAINDDQKFIDFSLNMSPDLFLEDGIHPNNEGHKIMMGNAKEILRKVLFL